MDSNIIELKIRYHHTLNSSFNMQDGFSIKKVVNRSKSVLPRGRTYHKIIKRMVRSYEQSVG